MCVCFDSSDAVASTPEVRVAATVLLPIVNSSKSIQRLSSWNMPMRCPVTRVGYTCTRQNCRSSVLWSSAQHWGHCATYAMVDGPEDPTQFEFCASRNCVSIRSTVYVYTRESSWNWTQNTGIVSAPHDRPRGLCYRPAVFCCHLRVIARSYPEGKTRCAFKNVVI